MKTRFTIAAFVSTTILGAAGALAASAPPLTSVQITRIDSPNVSESVSPGQSSTVNTYTQTPLYVTIREIGFGKSKITKLGGQQLSLSFTTTNLCGSASSPRTCNSGEIAIGSDLKYNLGQLGNGREFYFQDTSANPPTNTYSTQIIIK